MRVLVLLDPSPLPEQAADPVRGEKQFTKPYCSRCHGDNGEDDYCVGPKKMACVIHLSSPYLEKE